MLRGECPSGNCMVVIKKDDSWCIDNPLGIDEGVSTRSNHFGICMEVTI